MPLMIYCTAALTSFSDSICYIIYLFLEWRIVMITEEISRSGKLHSSMYSCETIKRQPKILFHRHCKVVDLSAENLLSDMTLDRQLRKRLRTRGGLSFM